MADGFKQGPTSANDGAASALLSAIVDSSDDAIISKDLDGAITSWNKSAERVFGYTAEEAIGQTVGELLIPPDHQDEEPDILRRLRKGERVDHFETVRRRKDGSLLDVSLTISPVKDKKGTIIGASKIARDITEQVRARAQITELAERLRITLTSIGDAVITTDASGNITFLNDVAQALTGWTNEEAAGKPLPEVFRIVNEDTRQTVENPVSKALREGRVVGLANHTVLIAKQGQEYAIDDSAAPIRDSKGNTVGVVLVFRDITTQRRAEQASRLLASIVESSDDAIIGKDLDGVITAWNQGAERIFGYSASEAVGQPVSMLAPLEHHDEMLEILERIRKGERVEHFETVRKRKDGKLLNISLTVSPVYDAEGRIIGASKIARDITEQVRTRAQFAELAERMRITLGSIGDAVVATDPEGAVTYMNPVAQDLTGWRLAEAAGKPLPEVFRIVNEETRKPVENPVSKVLREGSVIGLANHTVLIARGGKEYAIDDSAAPIRDADGNIVGVVMVFRDNTGPREAEERLRLAVDAAPNAMIMVGSDGCIELVNSQTRKLFGYEREDLIGQPVEMLVPARYRAGHGALRASFLSDPSARPMGAGRDLYGLRKDGREVPIEIGLNPISTSRGDFVLAAIIDISERKSAEDRLRLSEAQFRQLADSMPQIVWAARPDGYIDYYNRRWYEYTGFPEGQFGQSSWEPILHPDDVDRCVETYFGCIRAGQPYQIEYRFKDRITGGYRWFMGRALPIRNESGEIIRWFGTCTDVDDIKRTEEQLRTANEDLRRTAHLMEPVACFVRDLESRIVYWNPGATDLYGFSDQEARGQVIHTLLQTQFPAPLDDILAHLKATGTWDGELLHTCRDGRRLTVMSHWALHLDAEGRPEAILAVNLDITQRKEAELSLARTQELLTQELSGTRGLHELASRLLTLEDEPSILHEVLATALKITGADKGNIQLLHANGVLKIEAQHGFSEHFLDFFSSVRKGDDAACGEAFARGERVVVEDIERSPIFAGTPALKILLADGVRAVQSTPLMSRNGAVIGILSTHYATPRQPNERDLRLIDLLARQAADLIERIRVEEDLRASNVELARANEDLNQFAFAASHDLQEPLRMITLYSQLLMKGYRGQLDGEAATCIELITEGSKRMSELLADLLEYTQVANDREKSAAPVDLNRVFHIALANCKTAIDETNATVICDDLPIVLGQEPHFIQLLQNLISNSLKYRDPDRPPRIHASAERQNGFWRIAVKDNGMGIDPEYHQKIFGVFKRLHGKTISGTGIGLAICQRVVDRYGGRIWVESQVGQGATFYFTLPAVAEIGAAAND